MTFAGERREQDFRENGTVGNTDCRRSETWKQRLQSGPFHSSVRNELYRVIEKRDQKRVFKYNMLASILHYFHHLTS
ncbi:hypothetical protein L596_004357 [Steinernema carpocapsae]|uniref:Uncharacterized protein n=1 Tax=Steinernema carpocapsae TaxID=34508 RepID=A0A4U8UVK2_STECR|nr:hypothetical protein L596_004357 [Steinernema carpocapsae]